MKRENIDWRERWKEKSRQMFDNSEAKKSFENVFNDKTLNALLKLADRKIIKKMLGTIEAGKESAIYLAETPSNEKIILKIYMTEAGNFRNMKKYLQGDKRFRNIKDQRDVIVQEWCKKEYKNLLKAQKLVNTPEPIAFQKNILVMEFLGEGNKPYPKLKDVKIENPEGAHKRILNDMKRLWVEEELVHGDLSEYNMIVTSKPELYWIDFSQGLHKTHPQAKHLLKRDVENITNFFNKQGSQIEYQKALEAVTPDNNNSKDFFNV